MRLKRKEDYRKRRHLRVRKIVSGTAERPRMSVYVSNRHMYVQLVDDLAATTLVAASSLSKEIGAKRGKNDVKLAKEIGRLAGEKAKAKGIAAVVFDRGGFRYGGRVKALADGAREAGLKF